MVCAHLPPTLEEFAKRTSNSADSTALRLLPHLPRKYGCRKEQALVKGQEGPEEADGPIRTEGLVLR